MKISTVETIYITLLPHTKFNKVTVGRTPNT